MLLSDISIRRPVLATVMNLIVVLVGIMAYQNLTVREYPNIDQPIVTVETIYPGASAEIIESQVTQVLEDSIAGIEGIEYMTSISRSESSQITVIFEIERDLGEAASDVRDRVARVRDRLPDEVDEPLVQKSEADASPIIYLALTSDVFSAMEVTDVAERAVKDALQTQSGVAQVQVLGARRYAMRIWLDPERMAAYQLTPQDVEAALRAQNVEIPAGRIESQTREFTVLAETDLRTEQQFNNLVLKRGPNVLVRLSDVGQAMLGPADDRVKVRFNGQSGVVIGVVKQSTANTLEVSQAVAAALPEIRANLPEGMALNIGYDKAIFIDASIDNVYSTIVEAIVLVILIIFLFLRSVRATLVPLMTIPVSLIGAFALMSALGFSINLLTLLAMVLAIGLVVDDAIVMLENIYRYIEQGEHPFQAALKGSKEIGFAIIAMTLTLAAVFAPVGFLTGNTGRLFGEFAWTLAGAVLVSGFVALTLSPMMCSLLLRREREAQHGRFYVTVERWLDALTAGYRRLLGVALRHRKVVAGIGAAMAGLCVVFIMLLPSELAPTEDQGTIVVFMLGPEGATVDYMDEYARRAEGMFDQVPEVKDYFMVVGYPVASQGISFVILEHWSERERSQFEVTNQLRGQLFGGIPGIMAFASDPLPLGQNAGSKPVEFVVMTTRDYAELDSWMQQIMAKVSDYPGLLNPDVDLKLNQPQIKITMHRDKLQDLGLSAASVGRALETFFGGRKVTRFKQEGEQYDVIVQVADVDRENPNDLSRVYVRTPAGDMVQLANLITLEETVAPKSLNHFNQLRSATISGLVAPGHTLGEVLNYLETTAQDIIPQGAQIDYSGQSREFKESSNELWITLALAAAFIYLVLAAQFESFVDPLIIVLSVPLSFAGALLALWLSGGTLNIYSQVGLITLIGLITKHGILIVEFANQQQEKGLAVIDAVTEAAVLRLRPILMTTGAMVIGAMPLAIASGAGAESRHDIGWVIVGGLLIGTFFTLFVVPVVYSWMTRQRTAVASATE